MIYILCHTKKKINSQVFSHSEENGNKRIIMTYDHMQLINVLLQHKIRLASFLVVVEHCLV